jgi:hypothetical protein
MAFPGLKDVQMDFASWGKNLTGNVINIGETAGVNVTLRVGSSGNPATLELPGASTLRVQTVTFREITEETTVSSVVTTDTINVNDVANIGSATNAAGLNVYTGYPTIVKSFEIAADSGNVTIAEGTLTVSAGLLTAGNGLSVTSGTLTTGTGVDTTLGADLSVAGEIRLSGATATLTTTTAALTISTGGTGNITISPAGTQVIIPTGKLLRTTGGIEVDGGSLTTTSAVTTNLGGALDVAGIVTLTGAAPELTTSTGALTIATGGTALDITINPSGEIHTSKLLNADAGIAVANADINITNGALKVDGREVVSAGATIPFTREVQTVAASEGVANFTLTNTPRDSAVNATADTMFTEANMRVFVNGQLVRNWAIHETYTNIVKFDTKVPQNSEVVFEFLT